MVLLLGEVPIWFCRWGKSRDGLVVGEVPRCDVTPHIGVKRAQKIPRWKMCSNPMLEKCNFLHIVFINGRNI